jgi:hypothetical protein
MTPTIGPIKVPAIEYLLLNVNIAIVPSNQDKANKKTIA